MNGDTKHTPGPWWITDNPNSLNTYTVFHGPHGPSAYNQICETAKLADARLIAAATDMLAALKTAENALQKICSITDGTRCGWALKAVDEAIRKAAQ